MIIRDGELSAQLPITILADLQPELNEKFNIAIDRKFSPLASFTNVRFSKIIGFRMQNIDLLKSLYLLIELTSWTFFY